MQRHAGQGRGKVILLLILKAPLVDGSYHEVDSSDMAFKICSSIAFKGSYEKRM